MKNNAVEFSTEDISKALEQQSWMGIQDFQDTYYKSPVWTDNPPYYLFRVYGHLTDETQTSGLVHGSAFVMWNKFSRIKLSRAIKLFPQIPCCLVNVYAGNQDNAFYHDETLEDVFYGYDDNPGIAATDVSQFNEKEHFETNVANNKLLKTFILKFDNGYQFAELSDKSTLFQMMKNNEIPHTPKVKNQHSYRNPEREQADKWMQSWVATKNNPEL
ncbi:MAG: hypothetical protein FWF97_02575 [Alphaproteobacteria bacterium]|nr:hypothetical protein [Alphaproteobacteria bacterium]